MANIANITVQDGASSTFTWTAKTPAGNDLPARWAGSFLSATSRVGDAKLAFRLKRNGGDTADQFKVDMFLPKVCNGGVSCAIEQVSSRSTCSVSITIPDAFSTSERETIVELLLNTLSSDAFKAAMKAGESFY